MSNFSFAWTHKQNPPFIEKAWVSAELTISIGCMATLCWRRDRQPKPCRQSLERHFAGLTEESLEQASLNATQSGGVNERWMLHVRRTWAPWQQVNPGLSTRQAEAAGLLSREPLLARMEALMSAAATAFLDTLDDSEKTTAQPHLEKAEQAAESWRKTVLGSGRLAGSSPTISEVDRKRECCADGRHWREWSHARGKKSPSQRPTLASSVVSVGRSHEAGGSKFGCGTKGAWQQCAILPGVHGQQFFLLIVKHASSERHRTLESQ